MKKGLAVLCVVGWALVMMTAAAQVKAGVSVEGEEALIVLATESIGEMRETRKLIRGMGVKIRSVFPPSVFVGSLTAEAYANLIALDSIDEISYGKLESGDYLHRDSTVTDAIRWWNHRLEGVGPVSDEHEVFQDEAIFPADLPATRAEKEKKDKEYQERWKIKKEQLQNEGILPLGQEAEVAGASGDEEFGTAFGAGYYDTSLYMAGDVAVGVFFVSDGGSDWTSEQIDTTFAQIIYSLDRFVDDQPNGNLTFTYIKELRTNGSPKHPPANERDYANDLRNIYQTHWAYAILVYNTPTGNFAHRWGPSTTVNDGGSIIVTIRHETLHIFGAMDQYSSDTSPSCSQCSPINRWGYLNVVNANSRRNDGNGYFDGAGEGQSNILLFPSGLIGVYSRGQIGWRDTDGDGILDPLDTFPETVIQTRTGSESFTYSGITADQALLNERAGELYSDVTVNSIDAVEYRLNGGTWLRAEPVDGLFDSGEEEFTFSTTHLTDGNYTVEVRAVNSVGNTEILPAVEEITVSGSTASNVAPFAAFSVNPPRGSVETLFVLDAGESSDIEDDSALLEVRWDFEDDGTWDTPFSSVKNVSHSFGTAGTKTIRCEVKDTQDLTHSVTRQVETAGTNVPPTATFTATPESQHGDYSSFTVNMDASRSYDGEDGTAALQVRWDFEDDGVWDTEYSNTLSTTHSYPLLFPASEYWRIRLEVMDGNGQVSQATRDIWAVTYNNPPVLQEVVAEQVEMLECTSVGSSGKHANAYDVRTVGNYAYVADGESDLKILDVTAPSNPTLVGSYKTIDISYGIFVAGNYVYLAAGSAGLHIVDVSNPAAPSYVGSYLTPGIAYGVDVVGNYAYVASHLAGGLQIIDVTDPSQPEYVGSHLTTSYAFDVRVSGNYAYVADGLDGLKIFDVSNPANPVLVGSHDTQGNVFEIRLSGSYAYLADKVGGLKIFDVSNPVSPELAGHYLTSGFTKGIDLADSYAYIGDSLDGLIILDVTDPSSPTYAGGSTLLGSDVWAVSAADGYAYVALNADGMEVFATPTNNVMSFRALADDPDLNTTWDGLLEYRWDFDNDKVWDTEFSRLTYVAQSVAFDPAAVYCEVRDRFSATDSRMVAAGVDAVPVADAGPDLSAQTGQQVCFDGSGSTDDVGITLYEWDFETDGTWDASSVTACHTYNTEGTYNATLWVIDTAAQTDTDTAAVTVTIGGTTPALEITALVNNKTSYFTGETVTTTAMVRNNTAENKTDVFVDFLYLDQSGAALYTETESINRLRAGKSVDMVSTYTLGPSAPEGTYTVKATVRWNGQNYDSALNTYSVSNGGEENQDPLADAGPDQFALVRQNVTFDSSASFDPDGTITGYEWNFGDSKIGTGVLAVHSYKREGVYMVILTVTDDQGATGQDTAIVTVTK